MPGAAGSPLPPNPADCDNSPVACPDPALPEGDNLIGFDRCTAAGPVTVFGRVTAPDNAACPPTPGGVWEEIGWTDELGNTTLGAWPVLVPCADAADVEYQIACASTDGRLLLIRIEGGIVTVTNVDGSPIGDGATPVACAGKDYEIQSDCFREGLTFLTRLTILEMPAGTVAATVWIDDATGAVIPAPAAPVPCNNGDTEIGWDWGCAQRSCKSTNFQYVFAPGDMVSQTLVAVDGDEFTIRYVGSTPAITASFLEMWELLSRPGARGNFGGFIYYNPKAFIRNTTIDPVTIELTMNAVALLDPLSDAAVVCGHPEPDYTGSATILQNFWDSLTIGVPAPMSPFTLDVVYYTAGSTPVQLRKVIRADGELVETATIYAPGTPDHLVPFTPGVGESVEAGTCPKVFAATGICGGGAGPVQNVTQEAVSNNWSDILRSLVGGPVEELYNCPGIVVAGTQADAVVIDGVTLDLITNGTRFVTANLQDGWQFDSITIDAPFTVVPFGAPVVWSAGGDPTGTTTAALLQAELVTALGVAGLPQCLVTVDPSPFGADMNFVVTIYATSVASPTVEYLVSPNTVLSAYSFQSTAAAVNMVWQTPLDVQDCVPTSQATIEIVANIPIGETVFVGGHVVSAANPVFGDGPTPFTIAAGTGAPQTITYNLPLAGTDPTSGPYSLAGSDLLTLQPWIWCGNINYPGTNYSIDGARASVNYQCLQEGAAADLVQVCPDQIIAIVDGIVTGLQLPAARTFSPRIITDSAFATTIIPLGGVQSVAVVATAGTVNVLPPLDPPIQLRIGAEYQWGIADGRDRFDPAQIFVVQGNSADAAWEIVWEAQ
jgi:hypothetical protein